MKSAIFRVLFAILVVSVSGFSVSDVSAMRASEGEPKSLKIDKESEGPCTCLFDKHRVYVPEKVKYMDDWWECTEYLDNGYCAKVQIVEEDDVEDGKKSQALEVEQEHIPPHSYTDQLEDARAAIESEDYETSYKLLFPLAEQGYAEAQFELGELYSAGRGVEKDEVVASEWMMKSAEQGYAKAQLCLGFLYLEGLAVEKNEGVGVGWVEKASEQGCAEAQLFLGLMFFEGLGVEKDEVASAGWIKKSAEQGYAEAQYYLGVFFMEGIGVEKDPVAGADWLGKSAGQGNEDAEKMLFYYYVLQETTDIETDEVGVAE